MLGLNQSNKTGYEIGKPAYADLIYRLQPELIETATQIYPKETKALDIDSP